MTFDTGLIDRETFAALAAQWDAYVAAMHNPFLSHRFICAWWDCYPNRDIKVLLSRSGSGEILCGFPIEVDRYLPGPIMNQQIRYASIAIVPRQSIHISPSALSLGVDLELLIREIFSCVPTASRLSIEHVPAEDALLAQLDTFATRDTQLIQRVPGRASPFIDVAGDFDTLFGTYSGNTRSVLRRSQKKLAAAGKVRCERYAAIDMTAGRLQEAMEVSSQSWKGPLGSDMAGNPASAALYEKLSLGNIFEDIALWTLYLEGRPVAIQYHLIADSTAYLLRSDFDQALDKLAPGNALLLEVLRGYCDDPQIRTFDLCGEAYDYKRKIATGYHRHFNVKIYREGAVSNAARIAHWCKSKLAAGKTGEYEQLRDV